MANDKETLIRVDNVKFSYYLDTQPDDTDLKEAEPVQPMKPAEPMETNGTGTADAGEERRYAVDGVSLNVKRGEFLVIIGRNGSGKSTLAKLFNALLLPQSGSVRVKGMSTLDEESVWDIRRAVGMVFQNPDNQIVGTTVEEDVAFGVENLGVEPPLIRSRIDAAMRAAGVDELVDRPPYQLSGGQKQRVAIAGILAMKPECIVLDEATSMLDPDGRREVLSIVRELNEKEGIAVVLITHHMDEVRLSDRVIVMDNGRAVFEGLPNHLFSDAALVRGMGLEAPEITLLFDLLKDRGFCLPKGITGIEEAYKALVGCMEAANGGCEGCQL